MLIKISFSKTNQRKHIGKGNNYDNDGERRQVMQRRAIMMILAIIMMTMMMMVFMFSRSPVAPATQPVSRKTTSNIYAIFMTMMMVLFT